MVTRVFPGSDNPVRVVEDRTANGILVRPSRKLIKFTQVQISKHFVRVIIALM